MAADIVVHSCMIRMISTYTLTEKKSQRKMKKSYYNFCYSKKYLILNHMKHHITWHSPDNVAKMIMLSWIRYLVRNVRLYNFCFKSDHKLLVTKLATPANKMAGFRTHKKTPKYISNPL